MSIDQTPVPPDLPTIEYLVIEDEFSVLNQVFDELFEQIEKEIRGVNQQG